jgi:hypothetical protein
MVLAMRNTLRAGAIKIAMRHKHDQIWSKLRTAAGTDLWIFTCPAHGLLLAGGSSGS